MPTRAGDREDLPGEEHHPASSVRVAGAAGNLEDMTSPTVANPRRSTLASFAKGSELASCSGAGCHNVAVLVLATEQGRALVCRAHAGH